MIEEVKKTLTSFKPGFAGGQQTNDFVILLALITNFFNLALKEVVPEFARAIFQRGTLGDLNKKDGRALPIWVKVLFNVDQNSKINALII